MVLKLLLPGIVALVGLAAFIAYLVVANYAAASWAALATVLASVIVWDVWKNHRVERAQGIGLRGR